jgi:hypothetical protein
LLKETLRRPTHEERNTNYIQISKLSELLKHMLTTLIEKYKELFYQKTIVSK